MNAGVLAAHGSVDTAGKSHALEAMLVAPSEPKPDLVVIEAPFVGKSAHSAVANAWKGGGLEVAVRLLWPGASIWAPKAGTWRAVLKLAGGKREKVNDRVWRWAQEVVVKSRTRGASSALVTPRGARLYDEANAIGMAIAGWEAKCRR